MPLALMLTSSSLWISSSTSSRSSSSITLGTGKLLSEPFPEAPPPLICQPCQLPGRCRRLREEVRGRVGGSLRHFPAFIMACRVLMGWCGRLGCSNDGSPRQQGLAAPRRAVQGAGSCRAAPTQLRHVVAPSPVSTLLPLLLPRGCRRLRAGLPNCGIWAGATGELVKLADRKKVTCVRLNERQAVSSAFSGHPHHGHYAWEGSEPKRSNGSGPDHIGQR